MKRMIVFLVLSVLICAFISGCEAGDDIEPIIIGYVKNENAGCICPMLEYKSRCYSFEECDGEEELKEDLINGELQAAVLPLETARELKQHGIEIIAGISLANGIVFCVNRAEPQDITELIGEKIYIPDSIRGSYSYKMFLYLKKVSGVSTEDIFLPQSEIEKYIYSSEESMIFLLPFDYNTICIASDTDIEKCFELKNVWKAHCPESVPVSYALAIDPDDFSGPSRKYLNETLVNMDESIAFLNNHHSKGAVLLLDKGFADSFGRAKYTLKLSSYRYSDGRFLSEKLSSNNLLDNIK